MAKSNGKNQTDWVSIRRLRRLDTCAISDAMDQLKIHGAVTGLRAVSVRRRIAGRVVTVGLAKANGSKPKRHLCTAAVDASGRGDVIVVAHGGRLDVAGWGGILSLGAKRREVEGVVIDGACRDVDESVELDLPIYARATVPITARGRIVETSWNEPIKVGGLTVSPGDLVLADGSGVVFLPGGHAAAILDVAEQISAREAAMAAAVRAGKPLAEVMNSSYEDLAGKQP
jgi:4-hydroxy-4-methyl-2-oxoglutarate aldolase